MTAEGVGWGGDKEEIKAEKKLLEDGIGRG